MKWFLLFTILFSHNLWAQGREPNSPQPTEEEQRILDRGEISTNSYVIGGILGTYPLGLGIGHAIQGRYSEKGWIFTVGELGSLAVAVTGAYGSCTTSSSTNSASCSVSSNPALVLGVFAFVGLRIWEIIDLWATPPEMNARYRKLKKRYENSNDVSFYVKPETQGGLGLGLTFRY